MLGEKIGEETGKVTGQRVLSGDPFPKVETSYMSTGTLLGVATTEIGTYEANFRPDGTVFGEGTGLVTGKDGLKATWRGSGVGTMKPDGSVSYRGSLIYSTQSSKWLRLNSTSVIFEFEVDPTGKTSATAFEWK